MVQYQSNDLQSRDEIDRYMKEQFLCLCFWIILKEKCTGQIVGLKQCLVKRLINNTRANTKNQFDKVRPLSDEEKSDCLHTVDNLITNNFMTTVVWKWRL